ncbi:hypothetical protein AAY86_17680 [Pseudomonas amygdali pv. tabaci str. ATCC 11528]|nr:hypothetical protein C1E_0213270 [Pseudomonas amygdali pv. tabaci str. ATCC 11528]KKY51331.1 hypothetical protein AAY86_17680 [Pseudomonas amygdali pv. tabaci str. ATCC 11528]
MSVSNLRRAYLDRAQLTRLIQLLDRKEVLIIKVKLGDLGIRTDTRGCYGFADCDQPLAIMSFNDHLGRALVLLGDGLNFRLGQRLILI